jgi:predicted LPLAT superfamily acyltransferase
MEKSIHWSEEKEQGSYKSIRFMLILFRCLPVTLIRIFVYPVCFVFFLISKRGRNEAVRYQKHLLAHTNALRQILAFGFTMIEKMDGWSGRVTLDEIEFQNDDIGELRAQLDSGKGAVLLVSHLGNAELLRSLASYNRTGLQHAVPIASIVDMKSTEGFNKMLKQLNPSSVMDIVNARDIGPETIVMLQNVIAQGGLVVVAGDRTSMTTQNRSIMQPFLGTPAPFAYGAFFLVSLLSCPVYSVFALRIKDTGLFPKYRMYVNKFAVDFSGSRKERQTKTAELCAEFARRLGSYCRMYPFQWYNFYDFWAVPETVSGAAES